MKTVQAEKAIAKIVGMVEKESGQSVTSILIKDEKSGIGFGQSLSDVRSAKIILVEK